MITMDTYGHLFPASNDRAKLEAGRHRSSRSEYVTNIWDRNSCVRGNPPLRSGLRIRATRQAPFSRLPHAAS